MDVAEVLGNNAAQALGFQLFAPVDANISTGGSPLGNELFFFWCVAWLGMCTQFSLLATASVASNFRILVLYPVLSSYF